MFNEKWRTRYNSVERYRFRIVAANGRIVAVGAACESKAAAKRAIMLVRLHAGALLVGLTDITGWLWAGGLDAPHWDM